jgi:hypothetical protein
VRTDDLAVEVEHETADAGEDGREVQGFVIHPEWLLGGPLRRSPARWLADWELDKARPETRRLAAAFVRGGFTECGAQVKPKSATYIARAAGVSSRSAERFLSKGRTVGKLTPTGLRVGLVEGKRHTPLYHLTQPTGLRMEDVIPDEMRVEVAAPVAKFPAESAWPSSPWEAVTEAAPEWARAGSVG